MNGEIKKHVDSARDVLVGVVPNPTSQIEQITTALIYKFMDDMDQASISAGGEPSFFVEDLEKYSWTRLMDSRIGNQEKMNLYVEALLQFSESKQLPELFRSIFKSAFLPYRSPEVLGLFLKEINYFDYSHPEDLGDAYEYLLSIMSSQGDAGQFRTPRHIIDFIVKIVDPTKDDKILDPACGTAGFLISSYKHILEQHDGKGDSEEKPLTPDERKILMNNIEGYDIDPAMVRIAQVNMYLHQFKNPKIYQYDTLSMEERWNDKFDVVLANPPFMSPKGGIKPHSRFGIRSSRSEILFVNYIINHLKPAGKVGIIVPSSISINDNAKVYKEIRKEIMHAGLFAIVELHDYVFRPYAEVTTHILFIDKNRQNNNEIPIIKVKNDGYDKSDLRREIDGSELPSIVRYLNHNKLEGSLDVKFINIKNFWESDNCFFSAQLNDGKTIGVENGLPLGEFLIEEKEKCGDGNFEVWSVSNRLGFLIADHYFKKRVASRKLNNYKKIKPCFFAYNPSRINVGSIALNSTDKIGVVSPMYQVFSISKADLVLPEYLFYILKSEEFINLVKDNVKGATRKVIKFDKLKTFKIPVPPLSRQHEVIKLMNNYELKISELEQGITKIKEEKENLLTKTWQESF